MLFYLILHVWWLLVIWLPEPGISWKRHRQDTVPLHRQKFKKNSEIIILPDDERSQKGDKRGATGAPGATWPRPTSRSRLGLTWWPLVASSSPFCLYDLSDLKILGEASKTYSAATTGAETTEREKALRQGEICRGIPSRDRKSVV